MVKLWTPDDGLNDDPTSYERANGLDTWVFECRYGKAVAVPEEMSPGNMWCSYLVTFTYNNGLIVQDYYLRNMEFDKKRVRVDIERRFNDKQWGDFKEQEENIRNELTKDEIKKHEKESENESD